MRHALDRRRPHISGSKGVIQRSTHAAGSFSALHSTGGGKPWTEAEGRTALEFLDDKAQAEAVTANDRRVMEGGQAEKLIGTERAQPRVWLSGFRWQPNQKFVSARRFRHRQLISFNECRKSTCNADRLWLAKSLALGRI